MSKFRMRGLVFTLGLLTGSFVAVSVSAAPGFVPPGLVNLPPGRVKDKIDKLPAAAQKQAMEWLQRFNIPQEDYQSIDIDSEGGVFYVEAPAPEPADSSFTESIDPPQAISINDAFSLHSKPGASRVIFLDVDGHTIEGTVWDGGTPFVATPYDRDGNIYSFSQSELNDIAAIWHRVAEDYAAFDVDVTTEEPVQMGATTGRILITRSTDANGRAMPHNGAGGVAYVGVWGLGNYQYYQPALVYYNNLGGGAPRYVVEAASHEMGHNLGLSHDGTLSGTAYYNGQGSGYTKWAPIMGVGYNAHVSQWSKGSYNDANNTQDDIAIIRNNLSTSPDDHGDDSYSATLLAADASGIVYSTNPETDPFNYFTDNKGIIETASDVDVFQINAATGTIDLTIIPAWDAYLDTSARGANLDVQVSLINEQGTVLQVSNPLDDTYARIQSSVPAGVYYLSITGVGRGSALTTYDDYGSQGYYFIRGSIPASDSSNQSPVAQNDSAQTQEDTSVNIHPLANDSDADGDPLTVSSVSNGSFGSAITDGASVFYTPNTNKNGVDTLTYSVADGKGGFTNALITITVTAVNDAPMSMNDSGSTEQDQAVSLSVLANDSDVDGDVLSIASVSSAAHGSVTYTSNAVVYTPNAGYVGSDSFSYTAVDGAGGSATALVSITVTEKTFPPVTPSGLIILDGTDGTAQLSWNDTDNEAAFVIQRETQHKKRLTWNGTTTLASLSANTLQYTDASGTGTFRYRIRSENANGVSAWSDWVELNVSGGSTGGGGKGGGKGRNK
ncbi:MAG: tandem-95 repeat protein [Hahellaceae bacterium]|nr:tandem-95 repeat protein [Hahellaceae bacterium]MCP5209747.1 tandem-95 repeat protein [Hahellaceae bacterium]